MCGVFGFFQTRVSSETEYELQRCLSLLSRRGPDSSGTWIDPKGNLALGHTRLAILDLSPAGHQPMCSRSERYVISFNGEVYNYREIASELGGFGVSFRGGSDTEVLLAAFEQWGIEAALRRFNGMFSIALWDSVERKLFLCRDRLGIKPLYFGWNNDTFYFSSELKPIKAHSSFQPEISRESLALFMRHNYVPMPYSIYDGVYKLIPGTYLSLDEDQLQRGSEVFSPFVGEAKLSPTSYWSAHSHKTLSKDVSFDEALRECHRLLRSSISYRMISDVPLGAFLSGGIDSSLVIALMQEQSERPVKTFSIGFYEDNYNEAGYAEQVANHLKTEHCELYVTPEEAQGVIPDLPLMYDEPFADASQIPTYLVSKLAREEVTVSLSGDGGDELFCGYSRYIWAQNIWKYLRLSPSIGRALLSACIRGVSPATWDRILGIFSPCLPRSISSFHDPGEKLHRLATVLNANSAGELYTMVNTHWDGYDNQPVRGAGRVKNFINDFWPVAQDHIQLFSEIDIVSYLPDDILTKVDRASMYCSLEARVPMLDHRLVEFALSLPVEFKIREGKQKYPLRKLLSTYVPTELIDRPKRGFSVPIGQWLRGPLREWAEDLLSEESLSSHDLFNVNMVRSYWEAHRSGKRNFQYQLWDVLTFQSWYRHNF